MPSTDACVSEGTPMDVDSDVDPKLAEEKKAEGNRLYKAKKYQEAIQCYSEAIELDPKNASYYGNRSAARMMIDEYKGALDDSQASVKIDPTFAKGYLREGKCHIALGNSKAALLALQKAKEHDQSSGAIMAEFHEWDTILPPSAQEILLEMKDLAADGISKIMSVIGNEIEKDFREREEREKRGKLPVGQLGNSKSKWIRCRDGKYRNREEIEKLIQK